MSPEQARGDKDIDNRSDLYSLGIVVFQMLTGELPFNADTPVGLIMRHVMDPIPKARDVRPELPRTVEGVIQRAIAKRREARYPSAASLVADLATVTGAAKSARKRPDKPAPRPPEPAPPTARAAPPPPSTIIAVTSGLGKTVRAHPRLAAGSVLFVGLGAMGLVGVLVVLLVLALPRLGNSGGGTPATLVAQAPTSQPSAVAVAPSIEPEPSRTPEPASPVPTAVIAPPTATRTGPFSRPHPILSDVRVRQAIAYCTNRPELIASVYPWVDDPNSLLMDSFIPTDHWAHASGLPQYPFDRETGMALLDEAGWSLGSGASFRQNVSGEVLSLKFTTTTAAFRQTWATVFEAQMADCGIQIIRLHVPASWWFGDTTGLARRDFELGAFAWVGQGDPGGGTLYSCDAIPLPENDWTGQNHMGWCNPTASDAIEAANSALDRSASGSIGSSNKSSPRIWLACRSSIASKSWRPTATWRAFRHSPVRPTPPTMSTSGTSPARIRWCLASTRNRPRCGPLWSTRSSPIRPTT
jgi:hypothetical protein